MTGTTEKTGSKLPTKLHRVMMTEDCDYHVVVCAKCECRLGNNSADVFACEDDVLYIPTPGDLRGESYRVNLPFFCVACAVEMGVSEFAPGVTRIKGRSKTLSPGRAKTELVKLPDGVDPDLLDGVLYARDGAFQIRETGEVESVAEHILEGLFSSGLSRNKGWDEEDLDQAQIDALEGIEKSCGEFLRGLGKFEEWQDSVSEYAEELTAIASAND